MEFPGTLLEGTLIRRYKRFLADVQLADGSEVTAHCPNTGSMLGCCTPGSRVWLSHSDDPRRKLAYTWQLVETAPDTLACINTALPNAQVGQALTQGRIEALAGYRSRRAEVRYGSERSRIDWYLSDHETGQPDAYVEVKNVTLAERSVGYFPDAVTLRGQKHLRELMAMVDSGYRAVLLFCVNHSAITEVRPADGIDADYGLLLRAAAAQGVEVMAWRAALTVHRAELVAELPVVLDEARAVRLSRGVQPGCGRCRYVRSGR